MTQHDIKGTRNDAFDSELIELLYEIDAGEDNVTLALGQTQSDHEKDDQAESVQRIDDLVEALGVSATKWADAFLGGRLEAGLYAPIPLTRSAARRVSLHGMTIGKYLTERTFDALPIEMNENGEGDVHLSLAVDSNRVLNLSGEGNFEIIYPDYSDNPDSQEPSELWYEMKYVATIVKIAP